MQDDTSTHGSRTIDSRYSNDKTLGLSDGEEETDEEEEEEEEAFGAAHENDQSMKNGRLKAISREKDAAEVENGAGNGDASDSCACGLRHEGNETDGHIRVVPEAAGKLPSYLSKLGSMLEESGRDNRPPVSVPIHVKQGRVGAKQKLEINSVGFANDSEMVGVQPATAGVNNNANKIFSRKEVITTSYCKEEIKNTQTHEQLTTTFYDSNGDSSSLLLTTVERSKGQKHQQQQQQQQRRLENPDSPEVQIAENDDEGKHLANNIKKKSSGLMRGGSCSSSSNGSGNKHANNASCGAHLHPPANSDVVGQRVANSGNVQSAEECVVGGKKTRHRHKRVKSREEKSKEPKKESKSGRKSSSSKCHRPHRHGGEVAVPLGVEFHAVPLHQRTSKLTIAPIFQTSTLGTYCEYHQRHHRHHRHQRVLPRSEKEEEKKPLESQKSRRAKGSSKAASEFSNFMSISSGLSDTDKAGSQPPEMGNLVVCNLKLIEAITLPIAMGD